MRGPRGGNSTFLRAGSRRSLSGAKISSRRSRRNSKVLLQPCDSVQENPCQHGAVHTWHLAAPAAMSAYSLKTNPGQSSGAVTKRECVKENLRTLALSPCPGRLQSRLKAPPLRRPIPRRQSSPDVSIREAPDTCSRCGRRLEQLG